MRPGLVDDRSRAPALVPAEVLLVLVTTVSVAGFVRLFSDRDAVGPLLVLAVVAHLLALACRRAGLGVGGSTAAGALGLVLATSAVLYPHTSAFGLPTGATLDAVGDDLRTAWDLFGDVVAPAPSNRGFLLAAGVAIWLAAGLGDWAAFRLRATAEAVLPAGALFTFTVILGRGGGGVLLAAAVALAVLGFAVAQRTVKASFDDSWVGGRPGPGVAALARTGGLLVVAAALVAGAVAPRIPGTTSEALVDWRGDDGPDGRITVSPLVDIRSRLVQQSDVIVFQVRSDEPLYWRLTALDDFDGQVWASSEEFGKADGELPSEPPDATTRDVVQGFRIRALDTIWAPGAPVPVELLDSSTPLRWHGGLATLIVPSEVDDVDGASYTLRSRVADFRPEDLAQPLPDDLPDDVAAATEVPADLPSVVSELAQQVTAEVGATPYEQALALQDWFRREFTYDLDGVGAGHGESAIATFLAEQRGYCEQFAGTFAAMARTLGIPARVAVGFTPGELTGSVYTVRGRNAHAWPEVWIPEAGWVPFEPTPGRGQPGTEAYTGVEPAQDDSDPLPAPPTSTTTTVPSGGTASTTPPRPTTPQQPERDLAPPPVTTPDEPGDGLPGPLRGALVALAVAVGLVVLDVTVVALLRSARRRRRRHAPGVAGRVQAAWSDAVEALADVGTRPRPAETDAEFARRAATGTGPAAPALARLAGLATRVTWAPADRPVDPAVGEEADGLARQVRDAAAERRTWGDRLRRLLDPRVELRLR